MKEFLLSKNLRTIYLNDYYAELGAKFVPFSGYSMPINFPPGIIKEHLHTRTKSSIFDVSHMGQVMIPITETNINNLEMFIPSNLKELKSYQNIYSFLLNTSGGIIDDIIISKILFNSEEFFYIVYNASRKEIDEKIFKDYLTDIIIFNDRSLISLQGPLSWKFIHYYFPSAINLKFMQNVVIKYFEENIIVSRSGYTGEDGFELSIPNIHIKSIIDKFLSNDETILCGLGCRDSLRLEAGLCLYGNELNENVSPIQANLKWVISKSRLDKKNFNGCQKIITEIESSPSDIRVGIKATNKAIIRHGMELYDQNKIKIGKITSGGYSPTLNISIAMGYMQSNLLNKLNEIFCLIRNKYELVTISKLPFIQHNYKRR